MIFPAVLLLVLYLPPVRADGGPSHSQDSALPAAPSPKQDLGEARKLVESGHYKEALQTLQQIKAQSPNFSGLNRELGIVYYRLGDPANAIVALRQALLESSNDHEAQQLLGLSYFQLGKPGEAIPLLDKVASAMPNGNVDVAYVLGMCYLQNRDYAKARRSLATMYNVAPESPAAYLFTARLLFRQGLDSAAEDQARKAASLDPKLPLVHFLLGEIALFRSHFQQAREEFEQEIQFDPGYATAYDRLADTYIREGDLSKPEALLKRSILLDPNSTGPYILLGKFHLKVKDYPQAVIYLEKASRMDPGNFITHHLLGEAYRNLGKLADAERELKTAQELQSSQHPQVQE